MFKNKLQYIMSNVSSETISKKVECKKKISRPVIYVASHGFKDVPAYVYEKVSVKVINLDGTIEQIKENFEE